MVPLLCSTNWIKQLNGRLSQLDNLGQRFYDRLPQTVLPLNCLSIIYNYNKQFKNHLSLILLLVVLHRRVVGDSYMTAFFNIVHDKFYNDKVIVQVTATSKDMKKN